jgi:hypothetical protein
MKISIGLNTLLLATVLAASLVPTQNSAAQGTRSDYERALNLKKSTANKVFKSRVAAHWLPDNTQFWYRNDLSNERREFILVNAETGIRRTAFDHKRLAAELSKATGKEIQADRLPIDNLGFSKSGSELLFSSQSKRWKCDLQNYKIQEVSQDGQEITSLEPLGRLSASARTGEETSITFINRSKNDVKIYWLDSEGQRRHYATIHTDQTHQQHTFAGHAWLVTDDAGKTLAVFVATEEAADALIDDNLDNRIIKRHPKKETKRSGESPDGKWLAFIKDYNLCIRNLESEEEFTLSNDGTDSRVRGF